MYIKSNSITNLPASFFVALIATSLFFISIPLLTKISTIHKSTERKTGVMITYKKPPPPPEIEQEERIEEQAKQDIPDKTPPKHKMPKPRLNISANSLNPNMSGTIPITNMLTQDIEVTESLFASAYSLSEVDQRPRPYKKFRPQYPFDALRKGIEGKVIVKCVVDSTGVPREAEIAKVIPKEVEGVFDDAALACIMKFKFRPATKAGKDVDCIVMLPITFSASE